MPRRRAGGHGLPATRLTVGFAGIAAVILTLLLIQLYLGIPTAAGA